MAAVIDLGSAVADRVRRRGPGYRPTPAEEATMGRYARLRDRENEEAVTDPEPVAGIRRAVIAAADALDDADAWGLIDRPTVLLGGATPSDRLGDALSRADGVLASWRREYGSTGENVARALMREEAVLVGGPRLADLLAPMDDETMRSVLGRLSRTLDISQAFGRFIDAVRSGGAAARPPNGWRRSLTRRWPMVATLTDWWRCCGKRGSWPASRFRSRSLPSSRHDRSGRG